MTTPIVEALDHIRIATDDARGAVADYAAVLGRTADGMRLQLGNMAIELADGAGSTVSPDAADEAAPSHDLMLMFGVADLAEAMRRLARRGLPGAAKGDNAAILDRAATHGVGIGLAANPGDGRAAPTRDGGHDIVGLDHVVVRTRDPERAVALYGGRLGLDLRLDRTNPERGNRLLFFVCGDLVVEISHDTRKGVRPGPDGIWGMAWRSADIERSHARMSAAGVAVSEIRTGNRPGTRVFTVKSRTAGVPTLIIGGHGLERH